MKPPRNEPIRLERSVMPESTEPQRVESRAHMSVASEPEIPPLRTTMVDPAILEMMGGRPWLSMETVPLDGTMIECKDAAGKEFLAIWRRTSRHNGIRWEPVGFWSNPMNREPLNVGPVGWRMPDGFCMPGAVVA